MSLQATPAALVDLGSAALLLGLGLFVASVKPRRRANLAFAAFAGAFGAGFLAGNLLTPDDALSYGAGVVSSLFLVAAAAALVLLAVQVPRPVKAREARVPALAAGLVVAWHHLGVNLLGSCVAAGTCASLGQTYQGPFLHASLADVALLAGFTFALVLLALRFRDAQEPGRERARRQVALMAAALLLYPGLRAGFGIVPPWEVPGEQSFPFTQARAAVLPGLMVVVAGLWLHAMARAEGAERRTARNLAWLALALPVLGLALAPLLGGSAAAINSGLLGLARAGTVALLAIAIVRHQLLGVELRVKRTVRDGTLAAAFVAAYVVVSLGAQALLGGAAGQVLGLAAAALLLLAIFPLRRAADRVAERALPGVRDDSSYLASRRLDVYRAALEQAGAGEAGSTDQRVLAALRQQLHISDREHARLEAEVRGGAGLGELEPGKRALGRYRIEALLGEGGFGRTFLAWDEQVERRVVLKAAHLPGPREAERLLREARVLAKLRHPRVVTVHDVERVGNEVAVVLEHAAGGSLADRLRQGPLPLAEALRVMADVAEALAAAHGAGVLHRDVKPANILLDEHGRAKLADFGVARDPERSGTVSGLPGAGQPGTVRYMSPEQVRGQELDARSDLYALGVVLHEALAGEPYLDFRGRGDFESRRAILEEAPRLPLPGVPAGLNELLAACLAKDPGLRPDSADAVRQRLSAAVRTGRRRAP